METVKDTVNQTVHDESLKSNIEVDVKVPKTLAEAIQRFLVETTVKCLILAICGVVSLRVAYDWEPLDILVIPSVATFWWFQEWFIHNKLLHNESDWYGRRVHQRHHSNPYYHVSIDKPSLVLPFMILSEIFWLNLFRGNPGLGLTATGTYYVTGLIYEWTHYLVHTRVPMNSWIPRMIKNAHVRHHLKDERYWFSFTCPPIDDLLGTVPKKGSTSLKPRDGNKHIQELIRMD